MEETWKNKIFSSLGWKIWRSNWWKVL